MPLLQGAIIAFSHSRSCFIFVPEKWKLPYLAFQEMPIFKIEYDCNRTAYFSCKGYSSNPCLENEVQINSKYASALGITENEQVLIQQVERNIPHAELVCLEPLNSDDWEIMQLNAHTIERELLNQIRVVWKNQVFPVWAHQASFFVKVAEIEPDVEPALLVEWTEIRVTPKERNDPNLSNSLTREKKDLFSQFKHLRKRKTSSKSSDTSFSSTGGDEVDSIVKPQEVTLPNNYQNSGMRPGLSSLFRYMMKAVLQGEHSSSPFYAPNSSKHDFVPLNLKFQLRVISYSETNCDNLPLALQATTVFISDKTFCTFSDIYPIPLCFVVKLSKFLSPSELHEKQLTLQTQEAKDKSKKGKSDRSSGQIEKVSIYDALYVNVVVLKSLKEEFDVPLALFMNIGFIAVPLEITRRLGLEIASRVLCESVDTKPLLYNSIMLRPMESLHMNSGDDVVVTAFHEWVDNANLEDSSLVLSEGTLVKLKLSNGRFTDFIIHLGQGDTVDSPLSSPPSSLNTSASNVDPDRGSSTLPNILHYGYLNRALLQKLQIKIGRNSPQISKCIWCHAVGSNKVDLLYQKLPALSLEALGGVQEIAEKAMQDFELWFHLSPLTFESSGHSFHNGNMLIHGPKGVGKTTLVKALCKKFMNFPYFIFQCSIDCLPMRGKRVETIARKWDAILAEAAHRQPSIIVFENLDKLASSPATPEQEAGPDAIYFASVAQTFIALTLRIADSKANIVIIATSMSIHSLHATLTSAHGRHVFQSVLEIKPPNVRHRAEILQCLVLSKLQISADTLQTADWQALAAKTEGYVVQDLESLVDRATHAAFVRTNFITQNFEGNEQISLIEEDFDEALEKYTPSSLRGLNLQQGNNKTWDDVGGMHHVKKVIEQTLTWPVKYKELFKHYALKPQSNILLYGAPGTGKTLIATIVASKCGLNFISIKGPELLSKYIGASEQAVRDLFARAASAKPCVLFFDEFDALAPRRGHDSTGVTDRVVNQLLTQIDGVENLEGVYILAATSRPELIDPALLRPGRLDKCLHCPLPDVDERFEILKCLSSNLSLSEEIDFKMIAERTENFSGADIQALLYSAQIEALHDSLDNRSRRRSIIGHTVVNLPLEDSLIYMPTLEKGAVMPSPEEGAVLTQEINALLNNMEMKNDEAETRNRRSGSTVCMSIEMRHLLKVLSDMKPSVSAEERLHYELISQKFQKSRGSNFATQSKTSGKRVTLA